MTVMPRPAKKFIKKYHHALIGAGLSEEACAAVEALQRRGLAKYRPLGFIAVVMDGGVVDHPAWLPTELYPTPEAEELYGQEMRKHLFAPPRSKRGRTQ